MMKTAYILIVVLFSIGIQDGVSQEEIPMFIVVPIQRHVQP